MNHYQEQIAELTETANTIAHTVARGLGYDEYLIQVGRYRALREQVLTLKDKLKKREVAEDSEPLGGQVEEPTFRRPVVSRPRSWGGERGRQ